MKFTEINMELPEGRMLLAAVSIIMRHEPNKTPDQCMEGIGVVEKHVYPKPIEGVKGYLDGVRKAMEEDSEYYESWRDNISVAFQLEYEKYISETRNEEELKVFILRKYKIKEIANTAAENFLNLLIKS